MPLLSETPICEACWSEIPSQRENCCSRCGEDLFAPVAADSAGPTLCRACRMAPPAFAAATSFGVYEGTMRGTLHALKYDRMAPLARRLGELLAVAIARLADTAPNNLLVIPVPLHAERKAQRGFNQAETIAIEALRRLEQTHPGWRLELASGVLMRQTSTQIQAGLTPRQRRQNLRGAFWVSGAEHVEGRDILLIDDIYTTGATARACSKALMEAGASSVRVATVARAQRRVPLAVRENLQLIRLSLEEEQAVEAPSDMTVHS